MADDFTLTDMRAAYETLWTRVSGVMDRIRVWGSGRFGGGFFGQGTVPTRHFTDQSAGGTGFTES